MKFNAFQQSVHTHSLTVSQSFNLRLLQRLENTLQQGTFHLLWKGLQQVLEESNHTTVDASSYQRLSYILVIRETYGSN